MPADLFYTVAGWLSVAAVCSLMLLLPLLLQAVCACSAVLRGGRMDVSSLMLVLLLLQAVRAC